MKSITILGILVVALVTVVLFSGPVSAVYKVPLPCTVETCPKSTQIGVNTLDAIVENPNDYLSHPKNFETKNRRKHMSDNVEKLPIISTRKHMSDDVEK